MIDEVSFSSNSGAKATCRGCNRTIGRHSLKGIQKSYPYANYFCGKCTRNQLETAVEKVQELKKEFERLSIMTAEERADYMNRMKILKNLK